MTRTKPAILKMEMIVCVFRNIFREKFIYMKKKKNRER